MAHHLAEAICELAAPPLQPSFIRIVAQQGDFPTLTLLLHMRPRPLAAGLEVAAYSGVAADEEATSARIARQGRIYAVQQTQAGLEHFVADLLATMPEEWDFSLGVPCKLELPAHNSPADQEWTSVHLHLLPPSEVQASRYEDTPSLSVEMPSVYDAAGDALAAAQVSNRAATYSRVQANLKRQLEQHMSQQGASAAAVQPDTAAAARPQPDSQTEFQRKYRQLRNEVMAELQAALLAMLRQALRYRGTAEFPGVPPRAGQDAAGP